MQLFCNQSKKIRRCGGGTLRGFPNNGKRAAVSSRPFGVEKAAAPLFRESRGPPQRTHRPLTRTVPTFAGRDGFSAAYTPRRKMIAPDSAAAAAELCEAFPNNGKRAAVSSRPFSMYELEKGEGKCYIGNKTLLLLSYYRSAREKSTARRIPSQIVYNRFFLSIFSALSLFCCSFFRRVLYNNVC